MKNSKKDKNQEKRIPVMSWKGLRAMLYVSPGVLRGGVVYLVRIKEEQMWCRGGRGGDKTISVEREW